jgi:hypothetical protein
MPTDTGSMELYKSPEQDVEDVLRGIDELYAAAEAQIETPEEAPSVRDAAQAPEHLGELVDFAAMAERIAQHPADTAIVVDIARDIVTAREGFADAA